MNDFGALASAAARLRDRDASLQERIEAISKLERGLSEFSSNYPDMPDKRLREADMKRAVQISEITSVGNLPELQRLDQFAPQVASALRKLCTRPMSTELNADIATTLDAATHTARENAEQLQDLRWKVEREQNYRELLNDMLNLMEILAPASL